MEYLLEYGVNEKKETEYVKITKTLYPFEHHSIKDQVVLLVRRGKVERYRIELYMVKDLDDVVSRHNIFAIEFNDYEEEPPPFLSLNTLEIINSIHQLQKYIKAIMMYIKDVYIMSIDPFMEWVDVVTNHVS